jgi:hypothetical protein
MPDTGYMIRIRIQDTGAERYRREDKDKVQDTV